MTAHWISDGSEIPLDRAPGPRRRWRIGSWEFQRWERGCWGCCYRNMQGIGNCRTPIGAWLGLRRRLGDHVKPA